MTPASFCVWSMSHRGCVTAQGYAFEAASATLDYARQKLDLARVVAITSKDNIASRGLLEKLGFCFQQTIQLTPDNDELNLFALELAGDEEERN